MTEEPQLDHIADDDQQPTTIPVVRHELKALEDRLNRRFATIMHELKKTKYRVDLSEHRVPRK